MHLQTANLLLAPGTLQLRAADIMAGGRGRGHRRWTPDAAARHGLLRFQANDVPARSDLAAQRVRVASMSVRVGFGACMSANMLCIHPFKCQKVAGLAEEDLLHPDRAGRAAGLQRSIAERCCIKW